MGVTLPGWADGILDLAGVPWPNIDEDEMRKDAQAWRTVLAGSAPAAEGSDRTVQQASQHYKGASAAALADHWRQTGGTGYLRQANDAARYAPMVLDGGATVVTATKVAVVSQASVAAVRLAASMLAGGPLALGTATATVLAARYAMGRILNEAGEGGARVLAPALARKVTEPLERILRNARGPWGGGPPLAMAGGPRHIPAGLPRARPPGVDGPGKPAVVQMARRKNSANKTNSGAARAATRSDAESRARQAAADGGSRAVFRGPCAKDDHFHVDYLNTAGEIMHTRHFPY
ncbi:WXG100-like domain-containing protein [Sphaerisporangium aureirubrum]|uniref:Outer membrane channel protein CpnT-like N-terminal domain-containing protein n=1 Tax=Sphaerisporangium aureirubrum TaxID=1544736 RepID=A0ABW1NI92_9ACTN